MNGYNMAWSGLGGSGIGIGIGEWSSRLGEITSAKRITTRSYRRRLMGNMKGREGIRKEGRLGGCSGLEMVGKGA